MSIDFELGDTDYLNYGDPPWWSNEPEVTVSLWAKIESQTGDHYALSINDSSFHGLLIFIDNDWASTRFRTWEIFVGDGTSYYRVVGATDSINIGSWQHIFASFKANDANGVRLFIDGVEDANSPTSTVGSFNIPNGSSDLRIACNYAGANLFDGLMGEIAVWERTLDPAYAVSLANGASPLLIPGSLPSFYVRGLNAADDIDLIGGLDPTVNGTPADGTEHPEIWMPGNNIIVPPLAAAAPAGDVIPPPLHGLDNQHAAIMAHRLNGVIQ